MKLNIPIEYLIGKVWNAKKEIKTLEALMPCIPILGLSHNITIKKDRPILSHGPMSSKVKLLAAGVIYPLWSGIFTFENIL